MLRFLWTALMIGVLAIGATATSVFEVSALSSSSSAAAPDFADGQQFDDCNAEGWCPRMIVVPAGNFIMGSPGNEPGRDGDEGPQRTIHVSQFAAGVYEITFDEWDACAADGGCRSNPTPSDAGQGRGRRPVFNVSWNDVQEYVVWLSRRTGQTYRLLTEAEWEYAARAGTQTRFWWGRNTSPRQAQYNWTYNGAPEFTAPGRTAEVGSFAANTFGLYDVHGNVSEWVADCYNGSYAQRGNGEAESSVRSCAAHVLRGGSWNDIVPELRSADRFFPPYGERGYWMWGFRVARSLAPATDTPPTQPIVVWADAPSVRVGTPHPIVRLIMSDPRPPGGFADLDCLIEEGGRPNCSLVHESRQGHGFAEAALSTAAEFMRARPTLNDGVTPSVGVRTYVTIYLPAPGG